MKGEFTGRHMAAILVTGFGVVIAVNVLMASLAVGTFGGVVVDNSYVASQEFNKWLARADRSRSLGWEPSVNHRADGRVEISFADDASPDVLIATARHPLGRLPDTALMFRKVGAGQFVSEAPLTVGRWTLRLSGRAHEQVWRREVSLP